MRRFCNITILSTFIVCVTLCSDIFALKESTHKIINEFIAKNSINGFDLNIYLREQLGLSNGVYEDIIPQSSELRPEDGYQVWRWIGAGGEWEDCRLSRSANHFHNPLKPLDEAGFSGAFNIPFLYSGESSIIWFQKPVGEQKKGGNYSWHDVRSYFYNALTSKEKSVRDGNFADTFRGIGQLMHLMEDMSVSLHTRDDGHYLPNYETWVRDNITNLNDYSPVFFEGAVCKITEIFDTDQYDGTNPEVIAPGKRIGLSEYSNANFFSNGTIYKAGRSDFPYPYLDTQNIKVSSIIDRRDYTGTVLRKYHMWNDGYDDDYRLAVASFATTYMEMGAETEKEIRDYFPPILDDEIYKDYSKRLIPRAIGYASEVLKYFFRGRLEITLPETGAYSVISDPDALANPAEQGFDKIRVCVKNVSLYDEEMTGGKLTLMVKYRISQGDPFVIRDIPYATSDDFYYVTGETGDNITVPRNSPATFEFSLSEPVPLWATDVYIYLVYKGNMGTEENAVAVGFKDISEPTPLWIFNANDKICLFSEIYDSGSEDAVNVVDDPANGGNGNGRDGEYYTGACVISDIVYSFSPDTSPLRIEPGDHLKPFALLTDYEFTLNYTFLRFGFHLSDEGTYHGIRNQCENNIRWIPSFKKFRDVVIYTGSTLIHIINPYPKDKPPCLFPDAYDY